MFGGYVQGEPHKCHCADVKVHVIEATSPVGKAIAAAEHAQSQLAASHAAQLPLAIAHRIPDSFNLAATSAVVEGLDLPAMLPAQLRVPEFFILQSLAADVQDALRSTQQPLERGRTLAQSGAFNPLQRLVEPVLRAVGGSTRDTSGRSDQRQRRVARWVIKRCIRAAFELVQTEAQCYTRDLYWCCEAVQQHLPRALSKMQQQHAPAVTSAIQKSLSSLDGIVPSITLIRKVDKDSGHHDGSWKLAGAMWHLLDRYVAMEELPRQDVVGSTRAALRVVAVLDLLALAYMTTVPDQWRPGPGSNLPAQLLQASSNAVEPPDSVASILRAVPHSVSWDNLDQTRFAVAQDLASRKLLEENMVCAAVNLLPAAQSVREFAWSDAHDREAVCGVMETLQEDVVAAATFEPIVIRGGANSWLADHDWSIDQLVMRATDMRGTVRVSPSCQFPFVMPQHAAALANLAGPATSPSVTRHVRFQAFCNHVCKPFDSEIM